MTDFKDTRLEYDEWCASGYRCTGTRIDGNQCRAKCSKVALIYFWPGLSDRCLRHIDELLLRSRRIAAIAYKRAAAETERLTPFYRAREIEQILCANQATRPVAKCPTTPSMDHMSVAKAGPGPNVDDDPVKTRAMLKAGWQSWLPFPEEEA